MLWTYLFTHCLSLFSDALHYAGWTMLVELHSLLPLFLLPLQPVAIPTAFLLYGCWDEGLGKIVGMAFGFSLANFFILNVAERWQESSRQSFSKWSLQGTKVHSELHIMWTRPSCSSFFDLFSPFSFQRVIFVKLKQSDSITSALRAAISNALLPIMAWLQYKLYTRILN